MPAKQENGVEKHTKEPWEMPGGPSQLSDIFSDGDYEIYPPLGEAGPVAVAAGEANARRIVACVNACVGMATDVLERMHFKSAEHMTVSTLLHQRAELVEALNKARSDMEFHGLDVSYIDEVLRAGGGEL